MNMDLDTVSLDARVSAARQAEDAADFNGALLAWEHIRLDFPASPLGYSGSAAALRELNRVADANAILVEGLAKFPGDEDILVEYAWLAHHCSDWPEADRRWAAVRTRFPESFSGYFGGGAALRPLGRFDEADALYRAALERWPRASNLRADFAAVAQARGDFAEAGKRWAALRDLFPDEPDSYLRPARELRAAGFRAEAETLLAEALQRFPSNATALIEFAHLAAERGSPTQALKRWDAVATAFPGLVDGYVGAAHALNDLGRFSDAQNVLQPALRMFPDSANVAILHAWIAHYAGDFAAALDRWVTLRGRFPNNAAGHIGGVATLLALGRVAEANALIEAAAQLFPHDVRVAMDFARVPQHVQNWEEAERRWAAVHARFPAVLAAQSGYAQALSKNDKWDAAEALLEAALARHGDDIWALRAYADCAGQRRDWTAAEQRWRQVTERFPEHPIGWSGLGEALRGVGRFDDSEAVLAAAVRRFPDNVDLERQLALSAALRRDWPTALRHWAELKRKYPRNPGVLAGITQTLWQARQDLGVAASEGGPPPFEIPPSLLAVDEADGGDDAALGRLFLGFESIGDTCEFGIVQRRFGAEPISLLRWASTRPADLVTALDSKFAGVGEPEHTIIAVSHGEYTSKDDRYYMLSHTFTPETAEPLEKFTRQHLRRMQYLRRKLIDDLATGEKIFVYKCNHGLSDDEARAIHAAIRRYGGQPALMCVRLEDASHPRGTLELLDDGLFMGYIDRFSTVDINVAVWVELCQKTAALWQAAGETSRQGAGPVAEPAGERQA